VSPGFARAGLVLALLGAACGRKGPPLPPQWVIPDSPDAVLVEDAPTGVRVSWKRPRHYADGSALDDLERFEIQRACEPAVEFATIGTVQLIDRDRFRKETEFSVIDVDAPRARPCRYRVVAVTSDAYRSPPTESASIRRADPDAAR
jgi:hypothetical protein